MNDIICPNCNKAFQVDEASYASILKQVHNHEFDEALKDRLKRAEMEKITELKLAKKEKDNEILSLTHSKDAEIERLQAVINGNATTTELAVSNAIRQIEIERDDFKNKFEKAALKQELDETALKERHALQLKERDEAINQAQRYEGQAFH